MTHLFQHFHRLSERNCIEIIAKLVQDKKLDVVHTLDGKEYITPAQISREIRDELYVHGGQFTFFQLLGSIEHAEPNNLTYIVWLTALRITVTFYFTGRINIVDLQQVCLK